VQYVRCAVRHRPIVRKAVPTALVVGTVLTAINQGDALLSHHVTPALLWKIPLTYAVRRLTGLRTTSLSMGLAVRCQCPRPRDRHRSRQRTRW
jgi:hypothetical protein